MMGKSAYHVPDMSCVHCVGRISRVLESMGVEGFVVSLEEKRIIADAPFGNEVLKALEDAGYPVSKE
ncbi:MAG: heavy-metal-associated domain-containing protein [Thermovirgaceae bacterium]|nr:heavy-metal-associated domain-containing protein [Thermovirgaceae bacterium]